MRQDEQILENECRRLARQKGWIIWKNTPEGCKGIPDDTLLSPDGQRFYLVEFKTQTGRLRPEQKVWQARFPQLVKIVRSVEDFAELLQ